MAATAHTAEHYAIRALIDRRGPSLATSFFQGSIVSAADVARLYYGQEIGDEQFQTVQKVLKERLTDD